MDRHAVLMAFDEQLRRDPGSDEHDEHVIRSVPADGGWRGVRWSGLDDTTADAVIAAQISRFAAVSGPWEWKLYSYDEPADLAARLVAAGFTPQPTEALLVAEICGLTLDAPPPPGVELRTVTDRHDVDAFVSVHDQVFGGDHSGMGAALLTAITGNPPTSAAVLALAGNTPIAGGRVDFETGTDFASLWGGGTVTTWRGRGVFRSLVAHRAARAAARVCRYLQVDATPASQPILRRLGFEHLATTTPYLHHG